MKLIHVHLCTDIISYRNTPTGKARKTLATFAGHPETPDFTFCSTWLDNNEIIHVSIYFQAHPAQALQLATTYQCCIQAQSWPNISNKVPLVPVDHIAVQKEHHHFLSAPVPHQHEFC